MIGSDPGAGASGARVAITTDTTPATLEAYLPNESRTGVALCLSGGGSRAALFHLGVLRRLNETGVLSQVETITSVSGGSILAAHLAASLPTWPAPGLPIPDFEALVVPGFQSFVRRNMRTPPIARRWLLPWNWLNDQTQVDTLADLFERYLNPATLADLPATGPRYVFCASDDAFGVNWTFEHDLVGDYQAGHGSPGTRTVGRAAAASSCFPPVFDAMQAHASPADLTGGDFPRGTRRDVVVRGLRLSDGGLYDNLALEPVWKDHAVVIVSDGGALFGVGPDRGLLRRLKGYVHVMGRQGTSLRKRWLIASFVTGMMQGAYLGIGTPVARYESGTPGYSVDLVDGVIAAVRTDLDAFSDAEFEVLQNHGYLVAEAAIQRHLSNTGIPILAAALNAPYAGWLDETAVRHALAHSSQTKLPFGRGPWLRFLGPRRLWPRP